jgi:hypothetical protein
VRHAKWKMQYLERTNDARTAALEQAFRHPNCPASGPVEPLADGSVAYWLVTTVAVRVYRQLSGGSIRWAAQCRDRNHGDSPTDFMVPGFRFTRSPCQ